MRPEPRIKPDYSAIIEPVETAYYRVVWSRGALPYRSYLIDSGDIIPCQPIFALNSALWLAMP